LKFAGLMVAKRAKVVRRKYSCRRRKKKWTIKEAAFLLRSSTGAKN
jgi:hypothetical protein